MNLDLKIQFKNLINNSDLSNEDKELFLKVIEKISDEESERIYFILLSNRDKLKNICREIKEKVKILEERDLSKWEKKILEEKNIIAKQLLNFN